jgi:YegS/Rv2252/BmrU family lipid kinase
MAGDHSITQKIDYIIKKFQNNNVLVQPYRLLFDKKIKLEEVLTNNLYDYIVVSGGDGTLNHVINSMQKNNVNIPIGILPSGTSNDFSRCVNLPGSIIECIEIILAGNTVKIDAGLINNERYFLTTFAGGLFVDVSFNTNTELKRNLGTFAYYLQALTEIANIKSFKVKVNTDTESFEENILLFVVSNGRHAAGFNNLIREADMSDGLMDLVLIKNCNQIDLVGLLFKALNSGTFEDKNMIKIQAKECSIEYKQKINISIDGEEGTGSPISIEFKKELCEFFIK